MVLRSKLVIPSVVAVNSGGGDSPASGGGKLVGFVNHTMSIFPPAERLDYVRVDRNETVFPFTIGGVTFNSINDTAIFTGSQWVKYGFIPETNAIEVFKPVDESLSGTKTIQSDINIENKEAIEELRDLLNRVFHFKGYISTVAPTGAIAKGTYWYQSANLPKLEDFPINVKVWEIVENVGRWSTTTTPYNPSELDLWSNKNDDQGYYWFADKWNKIDSDIEYFKVVHTFTNVDGDTRTLYYLDTNYDTFKEGFYLFNGTNFNKIAGTEVFTDVDELPTSGISDSTIYRLTNYTYTDMYGVEFENIKLYKATGVVQIQASTSTFSIQTPQGMVIKPWRELTDEMIQDYINNGYITECKYDEALFCKIHDNSYNYITILRAKKDYELYHNPTKTVAGYIKITENSDVFIDVNSLPTTNITDQKVYRLNRRKYTKNDVEVTPTFYRIVDTRVVGIWSVAGDVVLGIRYYETPTSSPTQYTWRELTDSLIQSLEPCLRVVDTLAESNFCRIAENEYVYVNSVSEELICELYHNPTKKADGYILIGGGDSDVFIDVDELPTTNIDKQKIYRLKNYKYYYNGEHILSPVGYYSTEPSEITLDSYGVHIIQPPTADIPWENVVYDNLARFFLDQQLLPTDFEHAEMFELEEPASSNIIYRYKDSVTRETVYELYHNPTAANTDWKLIGSGNVFVDVQRLPVSNIDDQVIYRLIKNVYKENGVVLHNEPIAYTIIDGVLSLSPLGIEDESSGEVVLYTWSMINDEKVNEWIANQYIEVTTFADADFFKTNINSYCYNGSVTKELGWELYYNPTKDPNNYIKIGGEDNSDVFIDVVELPTTSIDVEKIYRIYEKDYYKDGQVIPTPLMFKIIDSTALVANDTGIVYTESGQTPVLYNWQDITDSLIDDWVSANLLALTTQREDADFFKVNSAEYVYKSKITYEEGYKLYHNPTATADGYLLIGADIDADVFIDVEETLPTTDITNQKIYRLSYYKFFKEQDDEEINEPTGYRVVDSSLEVDAGGVTYTEAGQDPVIYLWTDITDTLIQDWLDNNLIELVNDFENSDIFKLNSNEYVYKTEVRRELVRELYHNPTKNPADYLLIGGAGDVDIDRTTIIKVNGKLRANAIIDVDQLPTTNILQNTVYRIIENNPIRMVKLFTYDVIEGWRAHSKTFISRNDYGLLSEEQLMDGTAYIIEDSDEIYTPFTYNELTHKPSINGITLLDNLTLEDLSLYSRREIDDIIAQKAAAEFVDQLPADPAILVWYYSKKFSDGTEVPNDNRALYIKDKTGTLNYLGIAGDIDLANYYTKAQTDVQFNDRYTKTQVDNKFEDYYTQQQTDLLLDDKQDLLTMDSEYEIPDDINTLSSVNLTTKKVKNITFSNIWTWILSKIAGICEKGIQISSGKLGHTNSVTESTTDNLKSIAVDAQGHITSYTAKSLGRGLNESSNVIGHTNSITAQTGGIYYGNIDAQGHFTGKPTKMSYSGVYTSTGTNSLFTRTGAYNLYNFYQPVHYTGDNVMTISNVDGLSNGVDYASNVTRRITKVGNMVFFSCHIKWTSTEVSKMWTNVGTVASSFKPSYNRPTIVGMVYNNGTNEACGGNIDTNGIIQVWTDAKTAGNNYQIRITACWTV